MYDCPDEEFMCGNPGSLTCTGELADCSSNGDCFRGFCYCHIGWGGPACDVPICRDTCDDVRCCASRCAPVVGTM